MSTRVRSARRTYKKSAAVVAGGCAAAGLPCPSPGYDCVCRPCAPVPSTDVDVVAVSLQASSPHPSPPHPEMARSLPRRLTCSAARLRASQGDFSAGPEAAMARGAACARLQECIRVEQNTPVTFVFRDNLGDARRGARTREIS